MGLLDGRSGAVIRVAVAVVTLTIATFDLLSDWLLLGTFVRVGRGGDEDEGEGGRLTIALGVCCAISSLLYVLELYTAASVIRLYRRVDQPPPPDDPRVLRLERWQETASFLLLLLEDLPTTAVLYVAFRRGPCRLFLEVFSPDSATIAADLALLAAFLSALWKLVLSLRYCCCCCRCHDVRSCGARCCCCLARIIRPVFAIVLMAFAAFLYATFNNHGLEYRDDCFLNVTTPSG